MALTWVEHAPQGGSWNGHLPVTSRDPALGPGLLAVRVLPYPWEAEGFPEGRCWVVWAPGHGQVGPRHPTVEEAKVAAEAHVASQGR